MKTLKLFNSVLARDASEGTEPYIDLDEGLLITPDALWAKDEILDYYRGERLHGNDLNKTFHKSWKKIKNSTRVELFIEQIKHYASTYGSGFEDEIYKTERKTHPRSDGWVLRSVL